jgi:hypothetical protein
MKILIIISTLLATLFTVTANAAQQNHFKCIMTSSSNYDRTGNDSIELFFNVNSDDSYSLNSFNSSNPNGNTSAVFSGQVSKWDTLNIGNGKADLTYILMPLQNENGYIFISKVLAASEQNRGTTMKLVFENSIHLNLTKTYRYGVTASFDCGISN